MPRLHPLPVRGLREWGECVPGNVCRPLLPSWQTLVMMVVHRDESTDVAHWAFSVPGRLKAAQANEGQRCPGQIYCRGFRCCRSLQFASHARRYVERCRAGGNVELSR
jgi:hypothetical protein